jgi:hypothetical protein
MRVELSDVQAIGTGTSWNRASCTKDSLVVNAKLGLPLLVMSEVVDNLVRIPTVAVARLHSGTTASC